jgi:dimethylglycine dehydrogenase
LKGDLTVMNWGDGTYWLMGSYYLRAFHMRWFQSHLRDGVVVEDLSDQVTGFSLSGPNARNVLQSAADADLSDLSMMQCRPADLGLHQTKVARLSLSGELAFEVNCLAPNHAALRRLLLDAGAQHGIREIGFDAMVSLRLEKSIGIWNAEFTQGYTPAMTGLDRWCAWNKGEFIGREPAMAANPERILTMLEVDTTDADARGFEPVWRDDQMVGTTTSGGYGHRLRKSYALALLDADTRQIGTDLTVHVIGEPRPAKVIDMSPYDPTGARMRLKQ